MSEADDGVVFRHTDEDDTRLTVTRADGGLRFTAKIASATRVRTVAIDLPDVDARRLVEQLTRYLDPHGYREAR